MMRGKNSWALSVRDARGTLHTEEYPLPADGATASWKKWPLIRGVVSLVSSLVVGVRALTISANLASIGMDDEQESEQALAEGNDSVGHAVHGAGNDSVGRDTHGAPHVEPEQAAAADDVSSSDEEARALEDAKDQLSPAILIGTVVVALVMAVLLFIVAPAALTNLIVGSADKHVLLWNLVDGLLRVLAFFAYVLIIGRTPDIHRVFSYHGAEHKTIHCLEHGEELTPANAQKYTTLHLRCGTAFLLMVMVVAILIYTLVPIRLIATQLGITNSWLLLLVVIGIRLLFLPLIAGISYEITVKWAGNHEANPLVRVIMWPGLQMQRLTTAQPTDDMLEAAIAATKAVQAAEERAAAGLPAVEEPVAAAAA